MGFIEDIQKTALCGDGPIRCMLAKKRADFSGAPEELCISEPELVAGIHQEYLAAGARVIRTNSLHANALHFTQHISEINWQAAQIAKQVVKGTGAYVAGSVGPLNVPVEKSSQVIFQQQIGALLDGGVNLVVFENFSDVEELLLALYVKQSLHHCPAVCLLTSENSEAFLKLHDAGAEIVGVSNASHDNAISVPSDASLAVYLEARAVTSEAVCNLAKQGASLIGGGADTTPSDIQKIAEALRKLQED